MHSKTQIITQNPNLAWCPSSLWISMQTPQDHQAYMVKLEYIDTSSRFQAVIYVETQSVDVEEIGEAEEEVT